MSAAAQAENLVVLVARRGPTDRDRLLLALGEVGAVEPAMATPRAQQLLEPLFLALVRDAEQDIRRRLAERLAGAAWAPRALIRFLAADEIEVARKVIAESPLLADEDLIRLLLEATVEHRIEVAGRAGIGQDVAAAIIAQGDPAALTALAGNPHADVSPVDMALLVELSRPVVGLRAPLIRHPRLTEALAKRLYVWVGEALRGSLADRFAIDAIRLQAEIDAAVDLAHLSDSPLSSELAETEHRLVAKLAAAGQLRPGYLLRALRNERLALFETALASLGDYSDLQVRTALESTRPELLALACAGVGIDRSVFPTVLSLVRQLNQGGPGGGDDEEAIDAAFDQADAAAAAAEFRQAARRV